ncbi:MAG: D-alanine--D-alanine ligase family protein [Patescibacteria group bacterium]
MPKNKLKIGVLFGGRSAEHEVSLVSATSVIKNLDPKKYEVMPIGISKEGKWLSGDKVLSILKSQTAIPKQLISTLPADPTVKSLINLEQNKKSPKLVASGQGLGTKLDVIFPVLHGTFGEDGTVQGLLELASVPYVGAGVLGSAVGMDKIAQKMIFESNNIPTPKFSYFTASAWQKNKPLLIKDILKQIGLPCFIKPANLGSSVGISKAHNEKTLIQAINLAVKYDRRIIVEQAVANPLEIECAVLGNDNPEASVLGQIISSNEFYDYDAKYVDGKSQAVIPAPLPSKIAKEIQNYATAAFKALDLAGMARVDFLIQSNPWRIYLNEVNTIPGFTSISMYPKLWEASGLTYVKLLDKLINLAIERASAKIKLQTSFKPKKSWYKE